MEAYWDGKKEFRLGATESEAYRTWSERLQRDDHAPPIGNIAALLDRYAMEIVPKKAVKTQESNLISIRRLRPVFGAMRVQDIRPKHVFRYRDIVTRKHGPASANRDIEVASHALSIAVEWGVIDRNPIKGQVRKNKISRRERYVEDAELGTAMRFASPMLRAYIVLKLVTGLRRGDLLRLTTDAIRDDGIHVRPHKTAHTTGKRLIIEWTPALRQAVDAALDARGRGASKWLFRTNRGNPYIREDGTANAFDSLWQRFMRKVVDAGVGRFQEKDLRKKTASEIPLDHAQQLLGHASASTTERHYRILGDRVKPAK